MLAIDRMTLVTALPAAICDALSEHTLAVGHPLIESVTAAGKVPADGTILRL